MQEQLQRYESLFGKALYENAVTEFTFWYDQNIKQYLPTLVSTFYRGHSKKDVARRLRNNHLNESVKHNMWNEEYKDKLNMKNEIPSVFIDPVIDFEYAEEEEKEIDVKFTKLLFDLASRMEPYECSIYCEPPEGFFSGQPWLMEPKLEKKRTGSTAVFTWQIWLKGCGNSSGDDSYKLHFNNKEITNPLSLLVSIEESPLAKEKINHYL